MPVGTVLRFVRRFAVTGGRNFDDPLAVAIALLHFPPDAVLVHGAAMGADTACAEHWTLRGRKTEAHPARWSDPCQPSCKPGHRRIRQGIPDAFCPAAGVYRNQQMIDSGLDWLVAFPGGKGTRDMVARCKAAGVLINVVKP